MTWYERYLRNEHEPLDDAIKEWHTGNHRVALHEFLGLSQEQYEYTVLRFPDRPVPSPEQAKWYLEGWDDGYSYNRW